MWFVCGPIPDFGVQCFKHSCLQDVARRCKTLVYAQVAHSRLGGFSRHWDHHTGHSQSAPRILVLFKFKATL